MATITADALEEVLSQLNPQQRQAATHGESPLLIVAGAGTGKTTTLAHRVAWLIASGADPGRILLLTFTRRASAEMLRRVDAILRQLEASHPGGASITRQVWGGTFHAVAARLLRKHGKLIGLPPAFTIMDRGDSEDLMHVIREELDLAKLADSRFPLKGTCLSIYSRSVNTQQGLRHTLMHSFPWCEEHEEGLRQLFTSYTDRKQQHAILDYDDLLLFWKALAEHDEGGTILREKFDHVLVDEYQDTNIVQAGILKGICPDGQGLTIVGDDAQSIYSFRAATVRNILDFPQQYPGTEIVPLEQNYRSTQPILAATNQVISQATERHDKQLWSSRETGDPPWLVHCEDEDEQTDYLCERILEHREGGLPLKKQAVLFRASHHSMSLEAELSRRNIPFHKYGGLKFLEAAHIKDLLAFLRLAENPLDVVSGARCLTLLPGIGPTKARQLLAVLAEANGDFVAWEGFKPPKGAAPHWPALVDLLQSLAEPKGRQASVPPQVHRVRTFYGPLLERKYDNPKPRLNDLEQMEQVAGRYEDRRQFLTEMTLDPPSSTQDFSQETHLDEDYLILSTIHSAKGLEWDSVYVIHAADGNIPSDMAVDDPEQIEEERRLFYVALTRAKDFLYVTIPRRYYVSGRFRTDRYGFAQVTRFLDKPGREHFTVINGGNAVSDGKGAEGPIGLTPEEIRDGIKRMWE